MKTKNPLLKNVGLSRRSFLHAGMLAGAVTPGFPAIVSTRAPASKLNIAMVACGGRGGYNLRKMSGENIVALCDVNRTALDKAAQQFPQARTYKDFRNLFEKTDDIDAVVVSTCEHTHTMAVMRALRLKKHVYCEKPLTHHVHEVMPILTAAREAGVVTQMGTQNHANPNYHRVVELIQAGAIGAVSEVHVWVSRAWGWQSKEDAEKYKDTIHVQNRPRDEAPVAEDIDWYLWLGPAPSRPYHGVYFPGAKWYRWWDFGNGTMSDLGSHWIDLPWWAMNLDAPLTVESAGPPVHPEIAPASMTAKYTYGARGNRGPLTLTWYQGVMKPDIWTQGGIPQWTNGVLFVGKKGMLLADYQKHVLLPEKEFAGFQPPPQTIPPSPGHHEEWIAACKNGGTTGSNFDYAGPLTIANHLGNVAFRVGRKIEWDAKNLRITNAPDGEKYLGRPYRDGWYL